VAREVTPALFLLTRHSLPFNEHTIPVPESLQQRLCREFCVLSAELVDCEADLESIQELERCFKLESYDGEKRPVSK
jgi:hypothetical protein